MILVSGVTGCTSVSYYAQSLEGHVEIMTARQDVEKLIDDPSTPEALRARMASASAIRQFATDELALPDNNSYRSYVDVGRDAVTWAVFAAPEFSLTPRTWCFPVFGCVPYRGYFSKESAIETALELQRQGLDVYVTGITAYSTLGWSSDPLLSTMLSQDETYLAGLVFHELAHQRVYVNDDSAFNEAFAVAVETTGVRKWLRAAGDTAGLRRYEADRKRRAEFLALVSQTRDELRHVYDSAGTPDAEAGRKGSRDRTAADALPTDARQALGWIPALRCLVRCSDQQRKARRDFRLRRSRWRRFSACSTCVRATIHGSMRRFDGSAGWTRLTAPMRSRRQIMLLARSKLKGVGGAVQEWL